MFDWFALKLKRLVIRILTPELKGYDEWNEVDKADRVFTTIAILAVLGLVGSIGLLMWVCCR